MEGVEDVQGGVVRAGAAGLHGGGDEHAGGCPGVRSAPRYGAQDAGLFNAARATGGSHRSTEGPSWSVTPASSAAILESRPRAFPGSSATPPSASSSGCATSTGLRASTPSSRTTSGSAAAGPRRCSCRCPTAPGHAQCDFGEARVIIDGVEQKAHYFVLDLPHSDGCFIKAYPAETTEAFLDGHVSALSFLGGVPQSIALRQHQAGGGQDPGGRPAKAHPSLHRAPVSLPVRGPVRQAREGQRQGEGGGHGGATCAATFWCPYRPSRASRR